MRISDWSSDVCSPDLEIDDRCRLAAGRVEHRVVPEVEIDLELRPPLDGEGQEVAQRARRLLLRARHQVGSAVDVPTDDEDRPRRVEDGPLERGEIGGPVDQEGQARSEEHTSELQSLMRISYAVFCLKKKKKHMKTRQ